MKKIAGLLSSVVLAAVLAAAPSTFAATVENTVRIETKQQAMPVSQCITYADSVINLVNKERRSRGLHELKMIPRLTKAANIRVYEIEKLWDHKRPDGRSCFSVIEDVSLKSTTRGENIAYGYPDPATVVKSWMDSQGHRANILSPDYKYIGVGCAYINGDYYWTQEFIGTGEDFAYAYFPDKHGEVSEDGIVDAVDAALVLREYAAVSAGREYTLRSSQRAKAEMNGDDIVDAVDASIILNIYAVNSSR